MDQIKPTTVNELSKSQTIRFLDVFIIAPFLFYIGYKAKGLQKWEITGLYILALATLVYNGRNYLKNK
jgi:hypothetical protein